MCNLSDITNAMSDYNQHVTPVSECTAWGDYVADCHARLSCGPGGDNDAPEDFADYWMAVARGESGDYSPENGDRITK